MFEFLYICIKQSKVMQLDPDDKEYISAILSAHQARIERDIYMISTKLDLHIADANRQDCDVEQLKEDVNILKTESSNHSYKRKWQYAAIIIVSVVVTIITNLDKIGIF